MADNAVQRVSTSSVDRGQKLDYWNKVVCEGFDDLVVDADDSFEGSAEFRSLGSIEFSRVISSAARVSRIRPMNASPKGALLKLHIQEMGSSLSHHVGLDEVLQPGGFMLCDAAQPYTLEFTKPNHMMVLRFPTETLAARLGDPGRYVGRALDASMGGSRVLTAFLRSVWDAGDFDAHFERTLPDVIIDMLASALRPCLTEPIQADFRLQGIKAYIDDRLCDPDLRSASIASALGVSSRCMQMIFARAGLTVTDYIVQRRLDLAAERLRRGRGSMNITQTAYDIGFSDLTYFSKRFKQRFGLSPRDYRSTMN